MPDCLFCKLANKEIPTESVFESDHLFAFKDINPQAPHHVLIIPKKHIPSLAHLPETEPTLMGHMVNIANQLARREGVSESGYRLVINCGNEGGQLVPHLHLHLLGGKQLAGKMG